MVNFIVNNFMSLNWFSDKLEGVFFSIIYGIYAVISRLYAFLVNLATNMGSLGVFKFEGVMTSIYVLAGVFMLFRIVVSLLQMLVNPDMINDKQVGAGNLLVRIVVSVLMLLLFYPSGIIFNISDKPEDAGLQYKVENALLREDGLINSLFTEKTFSFTADKKVKKEKYCYYVSDDVSNRILETYVNIASVGRYSLLKKALTDGKMKAGDLDYYKIGYTKGKCKSSANRAEYNGYCYHSVGGTLKGNINFETFKTFESFSSGKKACPSEIKAKGHGKLTYVSSSMKKMEQLVEENEAEAALEDQVLLPNIGGVDENGEPLDSGLSLRDTAIKFSRVLAQTFLQCVSGDEANCTSVDDDSLFDTQSSVITAREEIGEGNVDLEFFMSLLVGIAVIVFLVLLLIDVIVRRFKLILLQIFAPIPIILYCNPKDTTFKEWGKMYISTYLDLFLKLLAVNLFVLFFDFIDSLDDGSGMAKLLYIFALLLFVKQVPGILSKIFGIEASSGTFKDIAGMGKKALGIGAAAAAGGVAGAITGSKGIGKVTGALGGALRGIGSGSKGNVLGGAQSISSYNAREQQGHQDGLNWFQRRQADAMSAVGISPKKKMDTDIKDKVDQKSMLDNFRKHKDNIEDKADSSNYMSDLLTKRSNGEIGKEEVKAQRDEFIAANEGVANWLRTVTDDSGRKITQIKDENNNWKAVDKDSVNYREAILGENGEIKGYKEKEFTYKDTSGNTISRTVKYEGSAEGKITQAEREMQAEVSVNTSLREELGITVDDVSTFKGFKDAESTAKDMSNDLSTKIIEVQKSSEYSKAQAMEDFSNTKK